MAKEILGIPEEHLRDVIAVIRAGLSAKIQVREDVRLNLQLWCDQTQDDLDAKEDNE